MIDSYSALQAAVAGFLNRDDLTATIPTFIRLGEAQLGRDVEHWKRDKRATSTADGQFLEMPADFHKPIRLHVGGQGDPLQPMAQNELMRARALSDTAGTPRFYAITGGEFELYPTPAEAVTVEMSYMADIPKLSDDAPTNWLLADFPDAYLYASLIHTAPYLHEDARAVTWAGIYQAAIDGITSESWNARHGGRLVIRGK